MESPATPAATLPPQCADHAQAATGVPMVTLTAYDPQSGVVTTLRSATGAMAAATRTFQAIIRLLPGFTPEGVSLTHRTNAYQSAIYIEGKTTEAPFREISRDAVPGFVIEIAERFLGVKHSCALPLTVNGQVRGALVFHTPSRPSDAQRRAFTAIAAQTSLTLASLLEAAQANRSALALQEASATFAQIEAESRLAAARVLHEQVQTPLLLAEVALRTAAESAPVDPLATARAIAEAQERLGGIREGAIPALEEQTYPQVLEMRPDAIIRLHADRAGRFADVTVGIAPALTPQVLDRVSTQARLALHRTLQYALENVEKHAGASHVHIRLDGGLPGGLTLTVQDDGRGFDPVTVTRRRGLLGIAACAGLCAGDWSVRSSLGSGTTLTSHLPIVPR